MPALPAGDGGALLQRGSGVHLVGRVGHLDDALLHGREVELVAQHPDLGDQQLVDVAKVDYGLVGQFALILFPQFIPSDITHCPTAIGTACPTAMRTASYISVSAVSMLTTSEYFIRLCTLSILRNFHQPL